MRFLLLFLCLPLVCFAQNSARQVIPINDNWKFSFVTTADKQATEKTVNLPHTWNADEVKDNARNYQRTAAVYRKNIWIANELSNKRFFLYFEGANSVADVFVNRKFIGNHKGGYTAFCFEITDWVKPGDSNQINVMVSNTYRLDVLPMSGDFNVYGGLHRPVSLIVTSPDCVTPLDFASPGVFIKQKNVNDNLAEFDVVSKLSLSKRGKALSLRTTILDADSTIVSSGDSPVQNDSVTQIFTLNKPHLWNGKTDPYMYNARVELLENGTVIDEVDQSFGLRYFGVDPDKGFSLNGRYLDLHGVAFHEDMEGKGSAFVLQDYLTEIGLINEIGATAVRMAHYPHGKPMYDLCDRNGIIVWTEIPLIGFGGYVGEGYVKSESLHQHIRETLTELIRQNYNHPSVCFWGLFNELTANFDSPVPFLEELNKLAHAEDPSRMTTCADMLDNSPFNAMSDVKAWNRYYGWYGNNVDYIGDWVDALHRELPLKPVGISEYGAGASIRQHSENVIQPVPFGKFHPEEWQTYFHEKYWEQLSVRPFLWSKFVWVLSDFGSSWRNEGDTVGINDKGLVTYDRKVKKDAFYFYKANWNRKPMIYLAEKRNTIRKNQVTDIKAYTNCPSAELLVNGQSLGVKTPDDIHRVIWEKVKLEKGANTIRLISPDGDKVLTDSCVWQIE